MSKPESPLSQFQAAVEDIFNGGEKRPPQTHTLDAWIYILKSSAENISGLPSAVRQAIGNGVQGIIQQAANLLPRRGETPPSNVPDSESH